jgi:serine/threonine-protein kinase
MPATLLGDPRVHSAEEAGPEAPRYAEVALLGEGGMGKVHLCRDERIGREVAMKVILPELSTKASTRARFLREASVQGQLEHPSIVPVHDIGVTPDGASFFTMKCVRGSTLEAVLSELASNVATTVERFTTRRLLAAFVNVCLAVDFAHTRGVVHRDLKPSNLMLGSFGEVYLLDWGIAKLADEQEEADGHVASTIVVGDAATPETAAGSLLGTLAYMAPEQMTGEPASVRSDVFALGAILFEILAGKPLRDEGATFVSLIKGKIDARCSVRSPDRHVAPELEAICLRATAAKPADRFASARALSEAVEKYLEGDRDVLRRREQAAAHVSRARLALARVSSTDDQPASTGAMRELGSALALDPDNIEARAMVVEALTALPREVPGEVRDDIERRANDSIVLGVRKWPVMMVSWIAFAPLLYFSGVKGLGVMAFGLALLGLATILGFVRAGRQSGPWLEYGSWVASALAMVIVGRGFGPFVVVPTLLATFATAVQLHPHARSRTVALGVCVVALVGAVLLELSGVLPHVHAVSTSALLMSEPTASGDLPITLIVLLMNVTAMVSAALTVAGVRAQLTKAEERVLVHAWQVRGMMPTEVGGRSQTSARPQDEDQRQK